MIPNNQNITYIEEAMLEVIAKHYPMPFIKIKATYIYIGRSFDLLLASIHYAITYKMRLDKAAQELLAKNSDLNITY